VGVVKRSRFRRNLTWELFSFSLVVNLREKGMEIIGTRVRRNVGLKSGLRGYIARKFVVDQKSEAGGRGEENDVWASSGCLVGPLDATLRFFPLPCERN
jgi:hypothetical protein